MERNPTHRPILCPSSQAETENAQVFGVVAGNLQDGLRVGYLDKPQPLTPDLAAVSGHAKPSEVMRIASPCMGNGCIHFDGSNCQIAARLASLLDPVVRALPRCAIRPDCRWFRQEGPAACVRCPQVITDLREASAVQRDLAGPGGVAESAGGVQPWNARAGDPHRHGP